MNAVTSLGAVKLPPITSISKQSKPNTATHSTLLGFSWNLLQMALIWIDCLNQSLDIHQFRDFILFRFPDFCSKILYTSRFITQNQNW